MATKLSTAICQLRALSGESQQFFGARLRISTRALQQYESGARIPEPRQLVAFAAYADFVQQSDILDLLIDELERQLEPPPGYPSAVIFKRRDYLVNTTNSDAAIIRKRGRGRGLLGV